MTTLYERLGIRPLINGAATLTRLGGSLMPPSVVRAMAEAAESFVELTVLQQRAGEYIARLTQNEAAYITSGAAAGLVLATASCITGPDDTRVKSLTDWTWRGGRDQIIIHRCQRNGYDFAVRQVGIELVEIGTRESTALEELTGALSDRTAAVVYFAGAHYAPGALPLDAVITHAHQRGVPVIVDAAAQLPPPDNLWNFTKAGADLVVFSGGKGLCGPQTSGLIFGRPDLIAACALHGSPNQAIGRPMKVGKEEIAGIVAAVEHYLQLDHVAIAAQYERQVQHVITALQDVPGVSVERSFPSEAGQPMPRALITLDPEMLTISSVQVLKELAEGDPSIFLSSAHTNGMYMNPQTLSDGQERVIAARLHALLTRTQARGVTDALV